MISINTHSQAAEPVDILEETVAIPAARGDLAGVLAYPLAGVPSHSALVVGPHPMMGGRLDNNVVRAVARGLAEHDWTTLRFAFSGFGPSVEIMDAFWRTGHAPDDPERIEEARAAARWFHRSAPPVTVLVGYSFGASLLPYLLGGLPDITRLALISPTLSQHDFSQVAGSSLPKLIVTSNNDFATPQDVVAGWFTACTKPKSLVVLECAEHFFHGHETRLVDEIVTWLHT